MYEFQFVCAYTHTHTHTHTHTLHTHTHMNTGSMLVCMALFCGTVLCRSIHAASTLVSQDRDGGDTKLLLAEPCLSPPLQLKTRELAQTHAHGTMCRVSYTAPCRDETHIQNGALIWRQPDEAMASDKPLRHPRSTTRHGPRMLASVASAKEKESTEPNVPPPSLIRGRDAWGGGAGDGARF
jgi:hypothetical protein